MSKVPEFLPLYDITSKSEERISELLAVVHTMNPVPSFFVAAAASGTASLPTLENDERLLAYAFLRSRSWHVKDAAKMIQVSAAFRERMKVAQFRFFPSPLSIRGFSEADMNARLGLPARASNPEDDKSFSCLNAVFKCGFHFWDKRGLPVIYYMTESIDPKAALKKVKQCVPVGTTLQAFSDHYVANLAETALQICRYQDKCLAEKPIPGIDAGAPKRNFVTVVIDARALSYKLLYGPVVDLLKDIVKRATAHYPDFIHRVLVVNCPTMARFAYSIFKPAMSEGLQKKFTFVSPEQTASALDRVIGLDRVPAFMGGKCKCADGCLKYYNPNAALTAEEDHSDVITEDIKLSPGQKHEKVFELAAGEDVIWDFVSTKGVDVRFSVLFYPKQDGVSVDQKKRKVRIDKKIKRTTRENPLVSANKITDGSDHYMAPEDGILQLVWDNSRSWTQDKPIQMRVYKSSALSDDDE